MRTADSTLDSLNCQRGLRCKVVPKTIGSSVQQPSQRNMVKYSETLPYMHNCSYSVAQIALQTVEDNQHAGIRRQFHSNTAIREAAGRLQFHFNL